MKRWHLVGIGLIIVYLVLAFATTQVLHFSRALDEGYHLEYITFIKQNGRLPINYEERAEITKSDYPPSYHLLVALLSSGIKFEEKPDFKYFWDSFRYRTIDHQQTENPWTFDTEDFQWPYYGRFLVWQVGRWVSVLLCLGTAIIVFFTLQDVPIGQKPLTSLFGAALLAFLPRYIIVGSSLNDDSLLGLLAALYFWMLVKVVKDSSRWWPFVLMGVLLGISVTVKYSVVLVPIEIVVVCSMITYYNRLGWLWWVKRLSTVGLLAIAAAGWWFGWIIWFFNTVAQDGWIVGTVKALFVGGYDITLNKIGDFLGGSPSSISERTVIVGDGTFLQWINGVFLSFWAYNVDGKYSFYPYSYLIIGAILISAVIGLWQLWHVNRKTRTWIGLTGFHVCLFFVLPALRFNLTRRVGETAQGRHILIPAATAVVALLVWGLMTIIPKRWRVTVFTLVVALSIGWTVAHLYQLSTFSSSALPMRTVAQAAEWLPESVNAKFGNEIELVGYKIDPQPELGHLNLELSWRLLEPVKQSYLVRVLVVDETGQSISQWVGYNGNGRLPTLAWDPGDTIFDRLTLPLPNLPSGKYSVQVQLINQNGQPVVVRTSNGEQPEVELTQILLDQTSDFEFSDDSLAVWHSSGPSEDLEFRYPGSFSIITPDSNSTVEILDTLGTAWEPVSMAGKVNTFVIGSRWPNGVYQIQINDQATKFSVNIENWWERQFNMPEMETPLEANFTDQVNLLGYYLPNNQVKAGEAFPITLYWQAPADKSPQADFIQFNNLLDNKGKLSGGYDRYPLEYYSTLLWAPGEVVVDGYAVPVDADAEPGEYYLDVGFYLTVGESAVNLPLMVDGEMSDVSSVTIGPIEVVAP